jgi:hypothetical protein
MVAGPRNQDFFSFNCFGKVTSATRDPSFCHTVLPGTLEGGADRSDFERSYCCRNLNSIFAIAIKDEKSRSRFNWKCFLHLLNNPEARRMIRHVEVKNLATIVTDHKESIKQAEPDRWNRKEIHRGDDFPMIAKKGQPEFCSFWVSRHPLHPSGDRSLGNIETQHEKFPVNARRSPGRILRDHPEDQFPHLLRNLSPSNRPWHSGNSLPIQPEASPMPSDHRFRGDHAKYLLPLGPEPSHQDPEQLFEYCESWPGMLPFQCRKLLTENEVFNQKALTCVEEAKNGAEQESKGPSYAQLLSRFACGTQGYIPLKFKADRVLANNSLLASTNCAAAE